MNWTIVHQIPVLKIIMSKSVNQCNRNNVVFISQDQCLSLWKNNRFPFTPTLIFDKCLSSASVLISQPGTIMLWQPSIPLSLCQVIEKDNE